MPQSDKYIRSSKTRTKRKAIREVPLPVRATLFLKLAWKTAGLWL